MNRLNLRFIDVDEHNVISAEIHCVMVDFHWRFDCVSSQIRYLPDDLIDFRNRQTPGLRRTINSKCEGPSARVIRERH